MKREGNIPEPMINKALKTLQAKALIKELVNIKSKGRKHFMATEFEHQRNSLVVHGMWRVNSIKNSLMFLKALLKNHMEA
ncbi:hypothetical protein ACSBR2_023487 [Camellia fascicularis]